MTDYKDVPAQFEDFEYSRRYSDDVANEREGTKSFDQPVKPRRLQIIRSRKELGQNVIKREAVHRNISHAKLKGKFDELCEKWKGETKFISSVHEKVLHPSYQQIIGLGWEALPFILEDLRKTNHFWFWALWAISGEDLIPRNLQGDIPAMSEIWIEWGQSKGLI